MDETSRSLLDRIRDPADAISWQRLVDLYTPLIRNWLHRWNVPQSDADDFVQEVLTVVAREVRAFQHNEQLGAFRNWLRTILFNRLRGYWRDRQRELKLSDTPDLLGRLEDSSSDLNRRWDQEHDSYVTQRLMQLIQPEFTDVTWQAFRRQVIEEVRAADVAAELGITPNAALIAKSRVLRRLREEIRGLVD